MVKKAEKVKIEREKEGAKETEELKQRYGGEDYVEEVLEKEKEEEKTAFGETTAEEKERIKRAKEVQEGLERQADEEKEEKKEEEEPKKEADKEKNGKDEMGELIERIQKAETKQEYNKLRGELEILEQERREGEREEKKEVEKELEEAEKEELKKDLSEAVDESVKNFIRNQMEIEKRDAELEGLKGKWFKGRQRKALQAAKEIAQRSAVRSQNNIEELKIDYLGLGLEEEEVKKIVQESFSRKGYSQEGIQEIMGKMFSEWKFEEGEETIEEEDTKKETREFLEGVETKEDLEKKFEDYVKEIIKEKGLTGNWEEDIKRIKKISLKGELKIEFEDIGKQTKKFEKETGISYKEILKKGLGGAGVFSLFLFAYFFWHLGNIIEKAEKGAPKAK